MKLERLSVERLPGLVRGFSLAPVSPGLNLVVGPNASGKTSLCRALRFLLYDQKCEGPITVEADFRDASGLLCASRQGSERRWTRDGRPVEEPALPDPRFASYFTVLFEDLLASPGPRTVDPIAARIATLLAGGYDLAQLRHEDGPFHLKRGHAASEGEACRKSALHVREVSAKHQRIRAEEDRLEELRREKRAADEAGARARACERALDLLAARQRLRALQEDLGRHPAGMELLTGREAERLEELRRKRAARGDEEQEARRRAEEARARGEAADLPGDEPQAARLDEERARLDELRAAEAERRAADKAARLAEARLAAAAEELGAAPPASGACIDPAAVARAEEGLVAKRDLEARSKALEAELMRLPRHGSQAGDLRRLRAGREELLRWLGLPEERPPRPRAPIVLALVLAATGAAATALATALSAPALHPAVWLLLLPLFVAVILLLLPPRRDPRRREAVRRFREARLKEPAAWAEAPVLDRLEELDRALSDMERTLRDLERRREIESVQEKHAAERAEVESGLAALAAAVGFDPTRLDASFERWLRLTRELDAARADAAERRAALAQAAAREQELRAGVLAFLGRFQEAPQAAAADAALLATRFTRLAARARERDQARHDHEAAERDRARALREAGEVEGEIARLFERAGLATEDDEAELVRRLGLLKRWRDLSKRSLEEQGKVEQAASLLQGHELLRALADEEREAELRARLEEEERRAAQGEEAGRRIAEIEKDVREARSGAALEEARAAAQAARQALAERYGHELFATAGAFLLEEVKREHETMSRPAVLERAARWFAAFTHNAFELRFADGDAPAFEAFDTEANACRPLEQLSSGTRMQLLLAVRLAFAQEAEKGKEPLPIFLDEALTASDPVRFRAVVEAVTRFSAEEGRQVFYLTAQPFDAAQWRAAGAEPFRIDLGALCSAQAASTAAELELPRPDEPPAPAGQSPEEYGALIGAARIDPFAPPSAVHVFHLLRDDLALLHLLLCHGVLRMGSLRSWLESPAAALLLQPEQVRDLRCRVAVAEAALEAWREGRGRPVGREELAQGGVSDTFLDRLASLAADLNGDASAVLDAIRARGDERVRGFHEKTRERLEEYLLEHGHLDRRPVLSPAEIGQRALEAAAPFVRDGMATPDQALSLARALLAPLRER